MSEYIGNWLWVLLVIFIGSRFIFALKLRKHLEQSPHSETELDMHSRERANNLTLAGFSLAAIALFLTIKETANGMPMSVNDTTFYLSISLISFIGAAYLYNYSTSRYYAYTAGTLEWLGLISVGISLLLFFVTFFIDDNRFLLIYYSFFSGVALLVIMEFSFYLDVIKNKNKLKENKE